MTNFEQFLQMMQGYLEERGQKVEIESNTSSLSKSMEKELPLCKSELKAIDMDAFAKKGYRRIILPKSKTENDSVNTADAFLINQTEKQYVAFDYENPMKFIRQNVTYILVFSSKDNAQDVTQMKNHHLKGENYLSVFMERLRGYIYKDAYAMTEMYFDMDFAKKFVY